MKRQAEEEEKVNKKKKAQKEQENEQEHPAPSTPVYKKIVPLWGRVSAGHGITAIPNTGTIEAPDDADFALKVKGDSMEPDFKDGEIIYIKNQPVIDSSQIGIVKVETDKDFKPNVYLKKIKINRDYMELISLNPEYKPMRFHAKYCRILGVALNKCEF